MSQRNWILISGVAFLISFGASAILVIFGNKLGELGITEKIYYLILIPLGFGSAAFLSGAMRSYASYKSDSKPLYGKLELGGPIVIFIIVVGGGFYMPKLSEDATTFDLKVRIFSDERETSSFEKGIMRLYIDEKTYLGNMYEGEVVFSTIPNEYHNKSARLEAIIEGYQLSKGGEVKISRDRQVIDLKVVKKPEYLSTVVRGNVYDENGYPIENAVVNFASGLAIGTTNKVGDFNLTIPSEAGVRLPLTILVDGKIRFNENVTLTSQTPYNFKIKTNP